MIERLTAWHCRGAVDPDEAVRRWTGGHVALVAAVPGAGGDRRSRPRRRGA